eukprot:Amastigsp_a185180_29.p2 type:complete len:117 gc:universal Amastigsp_a185180_29:256-606(+)
MRRSLSSRTSPIWCSAPPEACARLATASISCTTTGCFSSRAEPSWTLRSTPRSCSPTSSGSLVCSRPSSASSTKRTPCGPSAWRCSRRRPALRTRCERSTRRSTTLRSRSPKTFAT